MSDWREFLKQFIDEWNLQPFEDRRAPLTQFQTDFWKIYLSNKRLCIQSVDTRPRWQRLVREDIEKRLKNFYERHNYYVHGVSYPPLSIYD